jgi:hypothetical protein
MIPTSVFALIADTLLVRPVAVPTPWYSVASGVLSIVVTLLMLGIAVALLGMARAIKGAEHRLTGKMQGLAEELIPLAKNLNHVATQLSDITGHVRTDLHRLSGTIGAVDTAVRDAIDAGQSRLAEFATLLDVVQDEAEATVASATGLMRGVRTGATSLFSDVLGRKADRSRVKRPASRSAFRERPRDEDDVRARLAALEAAFAERDDSDDDEFDDDGDQDLVRHFRVVRDLRRNAARNAQDDDEFDDEDDDEDETEEIEDEYSSRVVGSDTDDDAESDEDDGDGAEASRRRGPRVRQRRRP